MNAPLQTLQSLATSAGLRQNERLLRLATPLGDGALVAERMTLDEDIGPAGATPAGLRAVVHALSGDAHLELKQLLGQPVLLQLELADGTLRPWHGHVTQAAQVGSDGGLARYRLVIEPWLALLGWRLDSWVFQDKSVKDIVEEVFARHAGGGQLQPAWRWELADASVYPRRSLCIQYQESDLQFVQRLLLEEGLFCWWEHADDRHTLVLADHNGAVQPAVQPRVRYTQAGMALQQDSLTRWREDSAVHTARISQASQDYRSNGAAVALRPLDHVGAPLATGLDGLALTDVPGQYAYEDAAQGQRLAQRQMQALDARRRSARASGTLRAAAPGRSITLADHPLHAGGQDDAHVILGVQHRARNNLNADAKAAVQTLRAAIQADQAPVAAGRASANDSEEPVYACVLQLQPLATPVRMSRNSAAGLPDVRLSPRPTIHGVQTAVVVGSGDAPVLTDRDHRIKLQFHWQRGAQSSHRLQGPAGADNAPASDASGTWVRVAEAWAGANWGSNFTPRVGQEVLVAFIGGDIDRPVVIGSLYNGQGQDNAQSNRVPQGAAKATGDAPAWFPGSQAAGRFNGHQHAMVLAGHKSQELATSGQGSGGSNQLVLDDTAGQGRIELATTSAASRLQLGHLLHQADNQRLNPRGHGLDLQTQAWGALRAGQGLLLSAHGRASQNQMDAQEAQQQIEQSRELVHELADSAQKHHAKTADEPVVAGAGDTDSARQLPVEQGLVATLDSLKVRQTRQQGGGGGGGTGTVAAWGRPELLIAAPAGIGCFTPAHAVLVAGKTAALVAGQDLQLNIQGKLSLAAHGGLVLFTYGKAGSPAKPNQETGIQLHAATGNVNMQSQQAATRLVADKAVDVASTQGMVRVAAPRHVLLTAAGSAIELKAGNITLRSTGKVEFKASVKELTGPASAQPGPLNFPRAELDIDKSARYPVSI